MYVTYALEKMRVDQESSSDQGSSSSEHPEAFHVQNDGSNNGRVLDQNIPIPHLSTRQVAIRVLQSYVDLICMKGDTTNLAKFSRAVTNKVC